MSKRSHSCPFQQSFSTMSVPAICAPPPLQALCPPPLSPTHPFYNRPPPLLYPPPPLGHPQQSHPPHPYASSASLNTTTTSNATYAWCHPVHSTPHHLNDSRWPEVCTSIHSIFQSIIISSSLFVVSMQ